MNSLSVSAESAEDNVVENAAERNGLILRFNNYKIW